MYLDANNCGSAPSFAPPSERTAHVVSKRPVDQELIESHLHLVHAAVARLKRRIPAYVDAADLYSVGLTGLVTAARKFNPVQGRTFAGFAALRIRGAMLDELRRMDTCSRRARVRARQLKASAEALEQKLGRAATDEELRSSLALTREQFRTWVGDAQPVTFVAIDRPVGETGETGASLHEFLADDTDRNGATQLEKEELVELLSRRLNELPASQRKILSMYYYDGRRVGEIAREFGVSSSRISQVHTRALDKIRTWLKAERDR